ncbi:phosphatase PAP2 family protein [Nocardia brasiliensis]
MFVPAGTAAASAATTLAALGSLSGLAALIAAAVLLLRSHGREAVRTLVLAAVLLAVCAATALSQGLFHRAGPPLMAADWTYPSGHGVIAGALACATVVLCTHLSAVPRRTLTAIAVVAPVPTLWSRLVLGEHYLLDITAAVLLTIGVCLLAVLALRLTPGLQQVRRRRSSSAAHGPL